MYVGKEDCQIVMGLGSNHNVIMKNGHDRVSC